MDRQHTEGGRKPINAKDWAGRPVGDRHPDQSEGRTRSGIGNAMDAVREVVNEESEIKADKTEGRTRSAAMDAVREVVEKE